jgi:hypothetical protein
LFYLRNLARESQLLTLPQLREEDRARLPIDEEQVYATFSFRASSGSYGQLFAEMAIDHPAAEEVITVYLDAIDKRFADYSTLQQFYRGEDKKGKVLYEEQQSRRYSQERRKLNEALFGELSDILNKAGLKPHQV